MSETADVFDVLKGVFGGVTVTFRKPGIAAIKLEDAQRLLSECNAKMNVSAARIEELEQALAIGREAICSIGSWDKALQDHYQRKLNLALASHAGREP